VVTVLDLTVAIHEGAVPPHVLNFAEIEYDLTGTERGEDRVIVRIGIVHDESIGRYLHREVCRLWTRSGRWLVEGILRMGMLFPLNLLYVTPTRDHLLLVRALVQVRKL
jgi:hypothetical protein